MISNDCFSGGPKTVTSLSQLRNLLGSCPLVIRNGFEGCPQFNAHQKFRDFLAMFDTEVLQSFMETKESFAPSVRQAGAVLDPSEDAFDSVHVGVGATAQHGEIQLTANVTGM